MAYNQIVPQQVRKEFRMALFGCVHCQVDKDNGRESITEAMKSQLSNGLKCDVAAILGDFSSEQEPIETPTHDAEGQEIANQLNGQILDRHCIYCLRGNHDAGKLNYDWYNKWIDTFGQNTATSGVTNSSRPITIIRDGSEEGHYALIKRNAIFFFCGDYNDMDSPIGRNSMVDGGYPSGAMSRKCWDFVKAQIALHPTKTAFLFAHHLLKETTIATGDNEGVNGGFHGSSGKPIASGRLEDIYDYSDDTNTSADEIITWMGNNSGKIFMWCGAHTHCFRNQTYSGRGQYIYKHGTHFLNVGASSMYHAGHDAMCRLMLFQNGSTELNIFQYLISSRLDAEPDERIYTDNNLVLTMPYAF